MTPSPSASHFAALFQSHATRGRATHELAAFGTAALPVLEALLSGDAKNEQGVAYKTLAQVTGCSFVTARMLGPLAKPLEARLREGLRDGHLYAVEALAALGSLDEETIQLLAQSLAGQILVAFEAAHALVNCGADGHSAVDAACSDPRAAKSLALARASKSAR